MIVESHDFQCLPRPLLKISSAHPVERPVKADQSFCAAVVQSNALSEKSNTAARAGMTKTHSEQTATAARGPHKAHGQVDSGAFASTVWPQETKNFSGFHSQAESVKSAKATLTGEATILFRDIVELEHHAHRRLF
jgi:hypothetical protein